MLGVEQEEAETVEQGLTYSVSWKIDAVETTELGRDLENRPGLDTYTPLRVYTDRPDRTVTGDVGKDRS